MENEKLKQISSELKQRQITAIKEVVTLTLEKLHALEREKNKLQEAAKMLKMDLVDLKEGRLDRILERQSINNEKPASVVVIGGGEADQRGGNQWYGDDIIPYPSALKPDEPPARISINNSISKMHASGTYKLGDGTIRYL